MKHLTLFTLLLAPALSALAQVPSTIPVTRDPATENKGTIVRIGAEVVRTARIQLGFPIMSIAPLPARAPTTVVAGTHVTLVPPTVEGGTVASVEWYKDGNRLEATGTTLEVASVGRGDSGSYSAIMRGSDANGPRTWSTDLVVVHVTHDGVRLLNLSSLVKINPAQPSVISGLAVEAGAGSMLLLVRAIGPTLQLFGVTDALATPQITVISGKTGAVVPPVSTAAGGEPTFPIYPSLATATKRVGAFPLPAASNDIAALYALTPGTYSVVLTSGDGGSGAALLETYEVPY